MPPKRRRGGLIGIIANDAARFSEFPACVTRLQTPPDWEIEWLIGGDWCSARNALAQLTVDEKFSHLWFMDDDHSFPPDILMKQLRWNKPLVNPICLTRTYPFQPVTYLEEGALDLASVPAEGLVELHAAGAAGMLIAREVLEAIEPPWFEYSDRSEDVIFCEKAKAAGFTLYGDLSARLGHITTAVVWPSYNEEHGWMTGLTIGKDMQISIPLTSDLVEREIHRIDVPVAPEEDDYYYIEGDEQPDPRNRDDNPHPDQEVADATGTAVPEPCLICGRQSTWRDVHGQQGCEEHHPEHEAWKTHYERAEVWFDADERLGENDARWHGRILNGDGTIAISLRATTQEKDMLDEIARTFPQLDIHFVLNELEDSRTDRRRGPPQRLWDRTAREER